MEETRTIDVLRITADGQAPKQEVVVREVPFTIVVNGKELATLLCTPSGLHHLAVGFLLSEGLLTRKDQLHKMSLNEKAWFIHIEMPETSFDTETFAARRLMTSGCAGAVSFYRNVDARDASPVQSGLRIERGRILSLMKEFQLTSTLFRETGGVHSSALAGSEGIEVFAEDIGRHNAVDKVFGECLMKDIVTRDKLLLTSGRISSDVLLKAAKQQVPFVVSPSAPTDLAVDLARKLALTVIGFVRGQRMNVYSGVERVA